MGLFERYLSVWVGLCILTGISNRLQWLFCGLQTALDIGFLNHKKALRLSPEGMVPLVSRPLEPFMLAIVSKAQHGGVKTFSFKSF